MHTYGADMTITLMNSWQLWLPVKKKKLEQDQPSKNSSIGVPIYGTF